MNWHFAYTPSIWPPFITVLLLLALAVFAWRRRNVPGALPFAIGCLFGVMWAAGSVMELAVVDIAIKIFWFKVQVVWQIPATTAITCFILEYTWPGRWLTRRNLALLSIVPLLVLVLALTNDFHHLIWTGFGFNGSLSPLVGLAGRFFIAYAFGLGIVNIIVFAWLFLRSPQHRWPVVIMATGQVGMRVIYVLEVAQVLRSDLPLDMLGIAFAYLMYTIVLFGFRMFDPILLARQAVITQMHEGALVLGPQGRVASLNPTAQAILGASAGDLRGCPILDLLPEYADVTGDLSTSGVDQVEISRGIESETRNYVLETSVLKDWRGLGVGRLLLLLDVTKQKQAQAQLVEQQRALAVLHEREHLSRELHDSIGQMLGYAGFQLDAVSKLVLDGQVGAATAQLGRLAGIVREAHADLREYILDLQSAPAPQQLFFTALRKYLDGFTQNYNIPTLLSVDERLGNEPFRPDARMEVFRILQEALSNVRKHGQAHCIQVTFVMEDQLVRMTIQDDGVGFDPDRSAVGGGNHFGLRFMRERAEALGGSLEVISRPGQTTTVVAWVPMMTISSIRKNEANDA
jgi:signal transduction histidine kinase